MEQQDLAVSETPHKGPRENPDRGPKYEVNIEGVIHEWRSATISTEEVAALGGFDPALGVLEIDLTTNEERQLRPGETIELKPGMGFAKKRRFRRG